MIGVPSMDDESESEYRKDMSHLEWEEVYQRQVARDATVPVFLDQLGVKSGDTVVEVGSGPGHTAVVVAERVGPDGVVYALDRERDALVYLQREVNDPSVRWIRPIITDAEALAVRFTDPVAVLLTFVLHHTDDPATVLREVFDAIATGSTLLVAEYHPEAAGDVGPPLDHRISPARLERWLTDAGFDIEERRDHDEEKYAYLAHKSGHAE